MRGLDGDEVSALGYQLILGNTYHLFVNPGPERIAAAGGLHGFMNWDRALITDSGGFQVFSLAHGGVANEVKGSGRNGGHGSKVEITEEGARFHSPRDGRELFISPEVSMEVQAALGADIALAFDECTPFHADRDYTARSTERTHRWLDRCVAWHEEHGPAGQALFGIVQGGTHEDLRRESAAYISEAGVDGIAIGGTLGRDKEEMAAVLAMTAPLLPEEAAKHLLGIGEVDDLLGGIALGLDVFDCAVPTRLARHGVALAPSPETRWRLDLRKGRWVGDKSPAGRGLPLPGVHPPHPRLHQLPVPRRRTDRGPPDRPPQPHLHARTDEPRKRMRSRPEPSRLPERSHGRRDSLGGRREGVLTLSERLVRGRGANLGRAAARVARVERGEGQGALSCDLFLVLRNEPLEFFDDLVDRVPGHLGDVDAGGLVGGEDHAGCHRARHQDQRDQREDEADEFREGGALAGLGRLGRPRRGLGFARVGRGAARFGFAAGFHPARRGRRGAVLGLGGGAVEVAGRGGVAADHAGRRVATAEVVERGDVFAFEAHLQAGRELVGTGVAAAGVALQRPQDGGAQRLGHLGVVGARRQRLLVLLAHRQLGQRGALVGQPPGEELVEDDAERVDVGPGVASSPRTCSGER